MVLLLAGSQVKVEIENVLKDESLRNKLKKTIDTKRRRCRIRASLEGTQARSLIINQAIRVGADRNGFTQKA